MTGAEAGSLGRAFVDRLGEATFARIGETGLANARRNAPLIAEGESIKALRGAQLAPGNSAIVIAAGPSIKKRDPIRAILDSGYTGTLIATESALAYCLRAGVVPHLTVTLDPHPDRVVRWFGVPGLADQHLREDDYFRRQDMDDTFARELETNAEMLDLMERHGRGMRIAVCSSASEAVVRRVHQVGMRPYWWNPLYDDPDDPDSLTRALSLSNGLPALNAGGNVGTAAWLIAHAVLGLDHVAVVGMDLGYYRDTPYLNTQYYDKIVELVGEDRLDEVFIPIHNPHLDALFYTDPAYMWYREVFLEMAADADCATYNCTEGGILFGDSVTTVPLSEFLSQFR